MYLHVYIICKQPVLTADAVYCIYPIFGQTWLSKDEENASLTLSGPNFRWHLSSAFSFSFFFLIIYSLKRSLYVKLKDWMPNSVDPGETAHHEPSHLDLCCLLKHIIIACGSERVNPFTLSRLFYHTSLDWSVSKNMVSGFYYYCFIEIPVFNAV